MSLEGGGWIRHQIAGALMHQFFDIGANTPPTRMPATILGRFLMVEAWGVGYLFYPPWIMPPLDPLHVVAKIAIVADT